LLMVNMHFTHVHRMILLKSASVAALDGVYPIPLKMPGLEMLVM